MATKFIDPLDSNNEPFEIPQAVLGQLAECTDGDFVIFYINDHGAPEQRGQFSCPAMELSLRAYITSFINAVNESEHRTNVESMMEDHDDEQE